MKRTSMLVNLVAGLLTILVLVAIQARWTPLGVRGEWEWLRVPFAPPAIEVAIAFAAVVLFAGFAAWGHGFLRKRESPARVVVCLIGLGIASVGVQLAAHSGAPYGYGLAKWVIALHQRGSSGYFSVAKEEVEDPRKFLTEYPSWVGRQDALHLGTHPPGLIVFEAIVLRWMRRSPMLARWVVAHAPGTVAEAFQAYGAMNGLTVADRATLVTTGFLTLLACALTVWPIYALARAWLPVPEAWATACLWPLAPSAILFQPTADTAFPLAATAALALATRVDSATVSRRVGAASACGILLGLGMEFSLVFLPVGLLAAVVILGSRKASWLAKFQAMVATGAGFLVVTFLAWGVARMNPFVVWWWNQKNHARFYEEFPRTYRAWVVANPIELAVALGVPATVWGLVALRWPGRLPRVSMATAGLLVFLTLGGRNLSEVARIWLPFMPGLLVAAGSAFGKVGLGSKGLAATIVLTGVETLALEAMIQVVYPV